MASKQAWKDRTASAELWEAYYRRQMVKLNDELADAQEQVEALGAALRARIIVSTERDIDKEALLHG